ncbi:hypothetical protein F8154_06140 [Alkaliphilus pronyensis]|uniref:Uncharacterized protein n=1 Tax=Alkaliphilus pronyensis TaxID=1482732 RepID=A0A6I0F659_9FIRM|nr:hypothetical protein [Alkaliphilus pronyensis]KAB3535519.1 hypothetical protein F8154_06140 [Alkaliphilus pronyensis]
MSIKSVLSRVFKNEEVQSDYVKVQLKPLDIEMSRNTNPDIPHEVTVVVPRAEIREKFNEKGQLIEREVILNSITVVHAPRHPLAGPPSPPPVIPEKADINFKPK